MRETKPTSIRAKGAEHDLLENPGLPAFSGISRSQRFQGLGYCPVPHFTDVELEGWSVLLWGPGRPGVDSGGCTHVGTALRDECLLYYDSPGNPSESDVDKTLLNVHN